MQNNHYPFSNLPLPYDYGALEPYIDAETMYFHHDKHLQTYIDNLNDILKEEPKLQELSLEQIIQTLPCLPYPLQKELRNNAGGVYNHRMFFNVMKPPVDRESKETDQCNPCFLALIEKSFGSLETFKNCFMEAGLSVFGSGYAWLVEYPGGLHIVTTVNQDNPLEYGLQPLLLLDVWEHAYYLKYQNLRKQYIENWFQVVDWTQIHSAEK